MAYQSSSGAPRDSKRPTPCPSHQRSRVAFSCAPSGPTSASALWQLRQSCRTSRRLCWTILPFTASEERHPVVAPQARTSYDLYACPSPWSRSLISGDGRETLAFVLTIGYRTITLSGSSMSRRAPDEIKALILGFARPASSGHGRASLTRCQPRIADSYRVVAG